MIAWKLNAVGYDNNRTAVKLAREKGVLAIDWLPVLKYDNILLADVIEHIENPQKELRCLDNLLSEKGFVYIVTPIKQPVLSKYHYREYTESELIEEMKELGYSVKEMIVKPEYKRMYAKFSKCH